MVGVLLSAMVSIGAASAFTDCAYDPARTRISRIMAVDSTKGPIYGHFLNMPANKLNNRALVLRDKEVILTFDDGPLPGNTNSVLDTLDKHCMKATFFSVGRMAQSNAKLLQEIDRRGHTIGTHTWSHPRAMDTMPIEDIKVEIEKGFAAVSNALGKPIPPFFRFPGLRDSPEAVAYMAKRNISIWSVDIISGDTEPGVTSAKIAKDVMTRVRQLGKGIILFHDIKKPTADALDGILTDLKQEGYKVVHVVSNTFYQPNAELIARSDFFRSTPETATITGRWVASAREHIKDGMVDVMHTEWIDLRRANERLVTTTQPAQPGQVQPSIASKSVARTQAQPGTQYSGSNWAVSERVR